MEEWTEEREQLYQMRRKAHELRNDEKRLVRNEKAR